MRNDAIEHHLVSHRGSRKRRVLQHAVEKAMPHDAHRTVAPAAIDEAFATLARNTGRINRLDAAPPIGNSWTVLEPIDHDSIRCDGRSLRQHLTAQLDTIDRQRVELARLLSRVNAEAGD